MSAKAPTRQDAATEGGVVVSTGTHVVAVVTGDETFGYLPRLGDAKRGPVSQDRARRLDQRSAESLAKLWGDYAEKSKLPESYVARPHDDLFGGAE